LRGEGKSFQPRGEEGGKPIPITTKDAGTMQQLPLKREELGDPKPKAGRNNSEHQKRSGK